MAYQNQYQDMNCVICFGKESKQMWLGFQQKRAELAAKQLRNLNADELRAVGRKLDEIRRCDSYKRFDEAA